MKRKNKIRGIREIALFFIIFLVFSIIGFSESVGAQTTNPAGQSAPDPNRLVVGQYKLKGGECVLEVGKYGELNERAMPAELSKAPKDKLIDGNLNLLSGKIDDSLIKQIQKECGENVVNVAKQMSSNPGNFKGQINFEKGEIKGFKYFNAKDVNDFNIDGFGKLNGKDIQIHTKQNGAINFDLNKDSSFVPDSKKFGKLTDKVNRLGQGSWDLKDETGFTRVSGKGLIDIHGDGRSTPVKFDNFLANLDKEGRYVGNMNVKVNKDYISDLPIKDGAKYQTINLNDQRFVDLTQNADLNAEFDNKGFIKSMNIAAKDGQVDGFGFLDKDSGINIKGASIEKNGNALIKAGEPNSKGGIDFYKIYSGEGKGRVFYQYDDKAKNFQYVASNDEKNALHVLKDKNLMSNQIDQKFLVNNKEVTLAKARTPDIVKPAEVSPGISKPLANDYIELVSSSNDINVKSGSPAMKLFEKDGGLGVATKGIQNANVVGPDGNIVYKLNGGKLDAMTRKSTFSFSEITNLDQVGTKRGFRVDPNGNWVDLNSKFKNTGGSPIGGKPGSPSEGPSSNGLTWLLVIGGVGAVAAYAFSKSGDKDKDKNKEKEVKNK